MINDVALDFWHSGQNREDIGMEDLEHRLRAETMASHGMLSQPVSRCSALLSFGLIVNFSSLPIHLGQEVKHFLYYCVNCKTFPICGLGG